MQMIRPARSLLACLLFCASTAGAGEAPPSAPSAGRDFGEGIHLSQATPLAAVLADPERYRDEPVLVRGVVSDVCQKKGCWTVIRDGEAHARVRFQDYGFFLPTNCQGAEVWVEGRAQVVDLSESEARHYAAESAHSDPEAVRGPQREVGLVATGVRLVELR